MQRISSDSSNLTHICVAIFQCEKLTLRKCLEVDLAIEKKLDKKNIKDSTLSK